MTTHPPPRTDSQGCEWTWDAVQCCYRHDNPGRFTQFSTSRELDEQDAVDNAVASAGLAGVSLGPEFRAVLVKVATGELNVDEAIGIARRFRSP